MCRNAGNTAQAIQLRCSRFYAAEGSCGRVRKRKCWSNGGTFVPCTGVAHRGSKPVVARWNTGGARVYGPTTRVRSPGHPPMGKPTGRWARSGECAVFRSSRRPHGDTKARILLSNPETQRPRDLWRTRLHHAQPTNKVAWLGYRGRWIATECRPCDHRDDGL